jgi:pSer/pThr/pTyr-binding forkhead associated (FHA) protein
MAQFVLEILDGDRAGDVLSLPEGTIRIGRKPGNDLVLADEKTSGVHAEIVFDGGRYVLRDLGSTNGTFLNGDRLEAQKYVELLHQDALRFGSSSREYVLIADDAAGK